MLFKNIIIICLKNIIFRKSSRVRKLEISWNKSKFKKIKLPKYLKAFKFIEERNLKATFYKNMKSCRKKFVKEMYEHNDFLFIPNFFLAFGIKLSVLENFLRFPTMGIFLAESKHF